ncbi:MAG: hypothetical protein C4522_15330 [Desulfobacteraceae bacterium]|nr:MAG: hypothetical protein C4522_15330 [Desulfobacteraceae bacterium]
MKKQILVVISLLMFLVSCGESDLPEDYVSVNNKILAIRITEPEVMPGDTVRMKLLVSGKDMDQASDIPVTWTVGSETEGLYHQEEVPYHQEFQIEVPDDAASGEPGVDIPVVATIMMDMKLLSSLKRFRITRNPEGMNPQISGIVAQWKSGNDSRNSTIMSGETITVDSTVANIALTVNTVALPEGANDVLIYNWYYTTSNSSDGMLEVNDDKDRIEEILGTGSMAAEFRQSVLLSLYGENGEGSYQKGTYNIYIVVRDNASQSNSRFEDRLGTDFYHFTLEAI